jgi:nucleotide-binding universal stress UspA family protein
VEGRQTPIDPLDWRLRRLEAESYLAGLASHLQAVGIHPEIQVLEGRAAETIIDVARDKNIDLIIIGSHGRSGLSQWTISSVAQKVVMHARTSVLLARTYRTASSQELIHAQPYHTILVPLDGSTRAEYVLGAIKPLLKRVELSGADDQLLGNGNGDSTRLERVDKPVRRCVVAHVVSRPEIPRQTQPTHEESLAAECLLNANRQMAEEYLGRLGERMGAPVESQLLDGTNSASSLHCLTQEESVDLVVLCAHGYSGMHQWPYGSVTMSFIYYSDAPLLIVQDLHELNDYATVAVETFHQTKGH